MRLAPVAVMMLVGCFQHMGDDYDLKPGGGDNGIVVSEIFDAGLTDGNDATSGITGRVCIVTDLRILTNCAAVGAGGLSVTLGAAVATTLADGTFTIAPPLGINPTFRITGNGIVPSVMAFGALPTIPVVRATTWDNLLLGNGLLLLPQQGSVVLGALRNGVPLAGATALATPTPGYATYYDGSSATTWNQNQTGAFGLIWLPAAQVGQLAVTVTPSVGAPVQTSTIVEDGAITFATLDVP